MARRRRWVAVIAAALLASGACGDDGDAAPTTTTTERTTTTSETTTTSTAPPRPTSTTTTMFDPASVEGEVEAAYLRSWEVYADAVYNLELDEAALAEVYGETALDTVTDELRRRLYEEATSLVVVDHDYVVSVVDTDNANVIDHYRNHQVRIDPATKEPIEDDPNELLLFNFQMKRIDGLWKVVFIQKVEA
jgi:SpoU rRNA methylase family enzyme